MSKWPGPAFLSRSPSVPLLQSFLSPTPRQSAMGRAHQRMPRQPSSGLAATCKPDFRRPRQRFHASPRRSTPGRRKHFISAVAGIVAGAAIGLSAGLLLAPLCHTTGSPKADANKSPGVADLQKELGDKKKLVESLEARLLTSEKSRGEATGEVKGLKEKLQQEQGKTQELEKKVENLELAMRNSKGTAGVGTAAGGTATTGPSSSSGTSNVASGGPLTQVAENHWAFDLPAGKKESGGLEMFSLPQKEIGWPVPEKCRQATAIKLLSPVPLDPLGGKASPPGPQVLVDLAVTDTVLPKTERIADMQLTPDGRILWHWGSNSKLATIGAYEKSGPLISTALKLSTILLLNSEGKELGRIQMFLPHTKDITIGQEVVLDLPTLKDAIEIAAQEKGKWATECRPDRIVFKSGAANFYVALDDTQSRVRLFARWGEGASPQDLDQKVKEAPSKRAAIQNLMRTDDEKIKREEQSIEGFKASIAKYQRDMDDFVKKNNMANLRNDRDKVAKSLPQLVGQGCEGVNESEAKKQKPEVYKEYIRLKKIVESLENDPTFTGLTKKMNKETENIKLAQKRIESANDTKKAKEGELPQIEAQEKSWHDAIQEIKQIGPLPILVRTRNLQGILATVTLHN